LKTSLHQETKYSNYTQIRRWVLLPRSEMMGNKKEFEEESKTRSSGFVSRSPSFFSQFLNNQVALMPTF